MMDDRGTGWRDASFDDGGRGRRTPGRSAVAAVLLAANFVILLAAIQHDTTRCSQDCFDGGLRTYEAGHPWTSYQNAWQWELLYVVGIGAFVVALVAALAVWRDAHRPRAERGLLALAGALAVTWVAWRLLEPPVVA